MKEVGVNKLIGVFCVIALLALAACGGGDKDKDNNGSPSASASATADGDNLDSDGDGVPNEDEDSDGDGVPDVDEDSDGDGVPDGDEDSDGDGVPDVFEDSDGDGIPDGNEQGTPEPDGGNGTPGPSGGPFPTAEVPPGQTPAPHGALDLVAIDTDTSGNTATSIATLERCASVPVGGTVTVDIVVVGIPPATADGGGIIGTEFYLLYDSTRLAVTSVNDKMIMVASPGGSMFTAGDTTPDSDGQLYVASLDVGPNAESGSGVMIRLTFEAVGQGTAAISITPVTGYYVNTVNSEQYFGDVSSAKIAVGTPC